MYGASLRDAGSACLVMELVAGGNLHQRIYDRALPRMTHLDILQARMRMRAPATCACMQARSAACSPPGPVLRPLGAAAHNDIADALRCLMQNVLIIPCSAWCDACRAEDVFLLQSACGCNKA